MKLCLKRDLNEMKKKAKQMNEGITSQAETKQVQWLLGQRVVSLN